MKAMLEGAGLPLAQPRVPARQGAGAEAKGFADALAPRGRDHLAARMRPDAGPEPAAEAEDAPPITVSGRTLPELFARTRVAEAAPEASEEDLLPKEADEAGPARDDIAFVASPTGPRPDEREQLAWGIERAAPESDEAAIDEEPASAATALESQPKMRAREDKTARPDRAMPDRQASDRLPDDAPDTASPPGLATDTAKPAPQRASAAGSEPDSQQSVRLAPPAALAPDGAPEDPGGPALGDEADGRVGHRTGLSADAVQGVSERASDANRRGGGPRLQGGEAAPVRVVEAQSFPAPPQPAPTGAVSTVVNALGELREWGGSTPVAQGQPTGAAPAGPVRSLTIQLHPAELGVVTARLRETDGQLSIELQVEQADAYRQLSADSDAILKAVRSLGIEVERVTVQPQGQPVASGRGDAGTHGGMMQDGAFSAPGGARQESGGRSGGSPAGGNRDEAEAVQQASHGAGRPSLDRGVYI